MNSVLGRSIFAIALTGMLAGNIARAADVNARLDRSEVVEGETVTLILQTDDPQQSLSTDLSAVEQNFAVLDQRSETQMSIVNGQQTAVVRLVLTLEPLRQGRLVIPGMEFDGGARTQPLEVSVKPAPELAPGEMAPVFLELDLDPQQGPYYVHAQLSLTVRIFYQQNLTEAAINPPAPQQASVRLLDEVPYQSTRNDVRYRVLERHYAIFPERSGTLEIPPLALTGRLIERPADRLWQPQVRGRRIKVESDPLKIEVLPKPDHYPGEYWLPARRITLSQQISDAQGLRVGEPVTRTIILDAVGLEENMIEEPTWPEMKDARIYPDQPQGISRDDGKWVLGHKEYRYAVVPEQPGELVLPEIRLQWWDTTSNSSKIAVLPEHRVPVAASNLSPDIPNPTPSTALPGNRASPAEAGALWRWRMATYALALLWLGTLALHLRRSAAKSNGQVGSQGPSGEDALLDSMKRACREGDASRARQTFGQWVRRYGPPGAYGSLMEFAAVAGDDELSLAIHALDEGAFRDSDAPAWEGRLLWERFSAWLKSRGRGAAEPAVEPDLYAEGKARHGG